LVWLLLLVWLLVWLLLLAHNLFWHNRTDYIHLLRIIVRYRSRANTQTNRAGIALLVWL
jgi:hypothetical protein